MMHRPLPQRPELCHPQRVPTTTSKRIHWVLTVLLALFGLRVAAQVVQRFWPTDALPAFAAWHSGLLPYPLLLSSQLLIIAGLAVITFRVAAGRIRPNPRLGAFLLSFGAIYFSAMLFRFGGALTFASAAGEFASTAIPAFFHLVLSGWLITLGLFHRPADPSEATAATGGLGPRLVGWLAYPVLIAVCLLLHFFLLSAGLGLQLSSYIPVAIGAAVITLLERRYPHRQEWQPTRTDVANDLTFMIVVQIMLPKVLAFLAAVTILRFLQKHEMVLRGWWPHGLPPLVQAALMLLAADFLRYWLHRASHEWVPWLWRFHAVHHSPQKLYWVNVGRFHPFEKSLQFLCDAAPFIILGVSENALAIYFVFYAVNGFFQHCNIELRLGLLNFIISGPELHRWHHSQEARESNKNYGNNVIIWDLLFGSYFLPRDRCVRTLGLRNRAYPPGFWRQLQTPFIAGIDQDQE